MSTPLYRQVARTIRQAIEDGTYAPGAVIPTERELAESLGVARSVVRQAIAELRTEGLLDSVRKRGTTVLPRSVRLALARYAATLRPDSKLGPWESACKAQGVDGRTELTGVEVRKADQEIATALHIEPGDPVIERRRQMWLGDRIAQVQTAYLPQKLAAGTPLASDGKIVGGIYAALTSMGHAPAAVTEAVGARTLTEDEAELMKSPKTATALTVSRQTFDAEGVPLEYLRAVALAQSVEMVYENLPIHGAA